MYFLRCGIAHRAIIIVIVIAGEREAVCGAEAHPGQAARPRGGWAAPDLSADPQGQDQAAQGRLNTLPCIQQ